MAYARIYCTLRISVCFIYFLSRNLFLLSIKIMRIFAFIWIILSGLSLDLFTKGYFERLLYDQDISIIWEWIRLSLSYNTGIAFSIPLTGVLLQAITPILVLLIVYHYIRNEYHKRSRFLDIWFALVLGGALSHTYERIVYGKVIDFIAVKYFAIFNFADIFISIGFVIILSYYVFYEGKQHR